MSSLPSRTSDSGPAMRCAPVRCACGVDWQHGSEITACMGCRRLVCPECRVKCWGCAAGLCSECAVPSEGQKACAECAAPAEASA
jgi:hypothetical protein